MIKNYFKIAIRNILRQKGYSLINILGLAVGLTVSFLILLWVQDEKDIDQFHKNGNQLFQVYANVEVGDGSIQTWGTVPFPAAKYIQETNQSALIQQTIDHLKMADLDTHYIPSKRLRRINEQVEIKPYSQ